MSASRVRCYNLPPLPSSAPPPVCQPSFFLCDVCQHTCGFCDVSSAGCRDSLPDRECESYSTLSIAPDAPRRNASEPFGFCDAVAPSTHGVVWEVRGGAIHNAARTAVHDESRARHCLARRTVVFMGDSNTRYQYLALAFLLTRGGFPRQPPNIRARDFGFNICSEGSVSALADTKKPLPADAKWQLFFNASSALLEGDEVCECSHGWRVENRWFSRGGVRLAFFNVVGARHSTTVADGEWGGGFDHAAAAASEACPPMRGCGHRARPSPPRISATQNWTELASRRLRPLLREGDVLVMGPGPWYSAQRSEAPALLAFMKDVKAMVGKSGAALFKSCPRGSVYFSSERARETRGCGNARGCDAIWRALAPAAGWAVLDLFGVTDALWRGAPLAWAPSWVPNQTSHQWLWLQEPSELPNASRLSPYTDNFHFTCDLYAEYNRMLLDAVCRAGGE